MWITALIFSNKNHGLQKTLIHGLYIVSAIDYVKITKLHIVHTWRRMQSEWMK